MQQQLQAQLDQRALHLQKLMEQAPEPLRKELLDMVELSWIYHESALEGVVYSPDELATALRGGTPSDPMTVSAFDEIRQNKATIDLIRSWAAQKRTQLDADVIKDIYASLAPDEVDGKKPPAYRKDIPLHRLYFHEIAAPDKIAPKLKAFGQWINATDTRRTTHALRLAAKAHFHLLHIYPYPKHSGKVARLVMNLLLLASGYPPAVIHSTERQRYYDALKTNENALAQIVKEALTASIESSIRFLESRLPPPAPPPAKKIKLMTRRRSEPPVKAEAPRSAAVASRPLSPPAKSQPPARATKPSKAPLPKPATTKAVVAKAAVAKAATAKTETAKTKPAPSRASTKPAARPTATKAKPAAKVTKAPRPAAKAAKPVRKSAAKVTSKAAPKTAKPKVARSTKPKALKVGKVLKAASRSTGKPRARRAA